MNWRCGEVGGEEEEREREREEKEKEREKEGERKRRGEVSDQLESRNLSRKYNKRAYPPFKD